MSDKIKSQGSNTFLWLFFVGYGLGWVTWWGRADQFNPLLINALQFASVIALVGSIFFLISRHGPFLLSIAPIKIKIVGFLCLFWQMMILGILNYAIKAELSLASLPGVLTGDVGSFAYYLAPLSLAFLTTKEWTRFLWVVAASVAIIFFVTFEQINLVKAAQYSDRSAVYADFVNVASLHNGIASAVMPLAAIGLALVNSRFTAIFASFVVPLVLTVALIYSKRQALLETLLYLAYLVSFFSSGKNTSSQRVLFLVLMAGCVGVLFNSIYQDTLNTLIDRLFGRVADLGEAGVANFNRLEEASDFFARAHVLSIVFGNGIGSTSDLLVAQWMMHLGYANLVFKGGVPFLLFVAIGLAFNTRAALKFRHLPYRNLVFYLSFYGLVQLGYAPCWGFVPSVLSIGLAFFSPEIVRIHYDRAEASARLRRG